MEFLNDRGLPIFHEAADYQQRWITEASYGRHALNRQMDDMSKWQSIIGSHPEAMQDAGDRTVVFLDKLPDSARLEAKKIIQESGKFGEYHKANQNPPRILEKEIRKSFLAAMADVELFDSKIEEAQRIINGHLSSFKPMGFEISVDLNKEIVIQDVIRPTLTNEEIL